MIGLTGVDAVDFNNRYMNTLGTRGFVLPGAVECVRTLSERYRIHLITNGTASVQHTRLADSGLLPYIDGVFISQEVGADKPSPVFFDTVLHAIGDPDRSQLLIVGDSPTSDIRGGMLSGIDTCWYMPQEIQLPDGIEATFRVHSYEELLILLA